MGVFSTNQVSQLFFKAGDAEVKKVAVKTGADSKAYYLLINDGEKDVRTPIIQSVNHVKYVTVAAPTDGQLKRKAFKIVLDGDAVVGQNYTIAITYRNNVGNQLAYSKFAEATAESTDAATLLKALAKSFLINQNVEPDALYELRLANGTVITSDTQINSITAAGFFVVEPEPNWVLGTFPQTLLNMSIATNPIKVVVSGVEIEKEQWMPKTSYKVVDATAECGVPVIPNSKKVADLEYFCKGERGNTASLQQPYFAQIPAGLKVNPANTTGYYVLTAHCMFTGDEIHNQESEKDIIIVSETSLDSVATMIKTGEAGE